MKPFQRWVLFWLVALAFLAPLKFGTPVSTQVFLVPPTSFYDWIFFAWPNELAALIVGGALIWMVMDPHRTAAKSDLLYYLPLAFLVTQLIATPGSICRQTTSDTVMHFAVCVLLFYAAAWYVHDGAVAAQVFNGLGLATFLILVYAMQQHYGGLDDTRDFAQMYGYDQRRDLHYKMMSDRVFATLGSPNTLAAYLVVTFAPMMAWIWVRGRTWNVRVKWLTLAFVGGLMIFCLALTGSRGGFIAFAAMLVAAVLCFIPAGSRRIGWVLGALAAIALVFLLAQRTGLIHIGTSSISSRTDYWRGSVKIAQDHPWLGTGPGTFGNIYPKYKTASSEEARLVHNDFLEMWSDSGVAGFVVFALLWLVALRDGFTLARQRQGDVASLAICASIAGWVVHGLVDFDLYVPAVAMPMFILLGVLHGLKGPAEREMVPATGKPRLILSTACVVIFATVVWSQSRSLVGWYNYGIASLLMDPIVTPNPDPVEAAARVQRSIHFDPANPHYHAYAGDLAIGFGKFDEAAGHYKQAIQYDPNRASYHWRLARALFATQGTVEQIRQELHRATDLNPTQTNYFNDLRGFEESIRQASPPLLESLPTEKHP